MNLWLIVIEFTILSFWISPLHFEIMTEKYLLNKWYIAKLNSNINFNFSFSFELTLALPPISQPPNHPPHISSENSAFGFKNISFQSWPKICLTGFIYGSIWMLIKVQEESTTVTINVFHDVMRVLRMFLLEKVNSALQNHENHKVLFEGLCRDQWRTMAGHGPCRPLIWFSVRLQPSLPT